MKRYDDTVYKEARQVAVVAHGGQLYDSIFPYSKHLDDVVKVLEGFGHSGRFIVAGYLHDAIEDGGLSYGKIKKHFGFDVAEMVFCVTDEMGRNRDEKKAKTLPKTASNPDAIILKLADRIANIRHGGKIDMYKKEYPAFKAALHPFSPEPAASGMWLTLEQLLGIRAMEALDGSGPVFLNTAVAPNG